jgi:hypothetical protein
MRLAYADPPYVGYSRYYNHPDAARWDDPAAHITLMAELDAAYDGWALSASSPSLAELLPGKPERARVAAWVKPFAAYKRNIRVAYAWEPVIFAPARLHSTDGAMVSRDFLAAGITLQRGLTGAKPEPFCEWVLDLLGYVEGDVVDDLFPGSGVMGRVLAQGRLDASFQLPLFDEGPAA